jgi:hypothetical protein
MSGIRFCVPRGLATLAALSVAAVLALQPWGESPTALADPMSVSWELTLDLASGSSLDVDADTVLDPGDSPDVVTTIKLDTEAGPINEPFFDLSNVLFSGLAPAMGVAIPDGAWVGEMSFSLQSNIMAGAASVSNVDALTGQPPVCDETGEPLGASGVRLYDADLNTGADADIDGTGPLAAGIVSHEDTDGDGLRQTEEDNFGADGSVGADGLYDGIDLMPDALANYVIPNLHYGYPIARSFGVATIHAGLLVTTDINILLYDLGEGDYLSVTILGYPGIPREEPSGENLVEQTVITCPPFISTVRLFGLTQPNNQPCCGGASPDVSGGYAQRTAMAAGTYGYEALVSSADNYDGDEAAAPYDSCRQTVSVDTDLAPDHEEGETGGDFGDRWDSSCDPYPATSDNDGDTLVGGTDYSYNVPALGSFPEDEDNCNQPYITSGGGWDCDQDVDGDTTLNTVDNCPFTPDADLTGDTVIDWQLDSDADTVGDVCDPSPFIKGDGTGYTTDAHPHGFPGQPEGYQDHDRICNDEFTVGAAEGIDNPPCVETVDSGNDGDPDFYDEDSSGGYSAGDPIDADSDADHDGHTDACEAMRGTDPLDPNSTPPGSPPEGDCDADGTSDDDEEVLDAQLTAADSDGDGCSDGEETDMNYDPAKWYDFYDVPVPARADMAPNGPRNRAVNLADVLAILLYVPSSEGGPANINGVDYDSVKGSCDVEGDGVPDEEGLCYDRSTSAPLNPPWDAGPPNGAINLSDVLAALAQVGTSCPGSP